MQAKDAQPAWHSGLAGGSRPARALVPAAILAATFLAYAGSLGFGFVFDDTAGIVRNDSLRAWHFVPGYFTSHVWSFLYPHLLSNYYRPLFLVWLRLNDAVFGLHPWGWHLTSALAHVAATYLVYSVALRLTKDDWVAAFTGLIFGLDPVHVEAVAYVSAVPELLCALCLLAALLAWLRSRNGGRKRTWLGVALVCYSAALFSKESAMMLPIFIALCAWIYGSRAGEEVGLGKWLSAAIGAAAPFLVVTLFYVPLRIWALKGFAHTVTAVDFRTVVLTIPSVVIFYLRLLFWPTGLSCYYDTPYIPAATMRGFFLPLVGTIVALAVVVAWYFQTRQKDPAEGRTLAFAALWTAIAILPVLNFRLLPEGEIAHDRYLYLPSVGFSLLVALALGQALRAGELRSRPMWVAAGTLAACLLLGFGTVRQSLFWSDDLTLNYRAHEIAPQNVYATTSLAAAVATRGMDGPAMALYQQALAIKPQLWRANVNVAYLYYAHGDYPQAARFFENACAADPTDGDQFLYLGMSLMRIGQPAEAEKAVRTALLVRPQGKNYHLGLGMVLRGEGKLSEAREEVAAELAQEPQNAQARSLMVEITTQLESPAERSAGEPPSKEPSKYTK